MADMLIRKPAGQGSISHQGGVDLSQFPGLPNLNWVPEKGSLESQDCLYSISYITRQVLKRHLPSFPNVCKGSFSLENSNEGFII